MKSTIIGISLAAAIVAANTPANADYFDESFSADIQTILEIDTRAKRSGKEMRAIQSDIMALVKQVEASASADPISAVRDLIALSTQYERLVLVAQTERISLQTTAPYWVSRRAINIIKEALPKKDVRRADLYLEMADILRGQDNHMFRSRMMRARDIYKLHSNYIGLARVFTAWGIHTMETADSVTGRGLLENAIDAYAKADIKDQRVAELHDIIAYSHDAWGNEKKAAAHRQALAELGVTLPNRRPVIVRLLPRLDQYKTMNESSKYHKMAPAIVDGAARPEIKYTAQFRHCGFKFCAEIAPSVLSLSSDNFHLTYASAAQAF